MSNQRTDLTLQGLGIDPAMREFGPEEMGGRRQKVPSRMMHALVRRGLTNKEIRAVVLAELGIDYSSAAVSYFKLHHGYDVKQPTEMALKLIPWRVATDDRADPLYRYLMAEARWRSGAELDYQARMHRDRVARLIAEQSENEADVRVISYSFADGWAMVERRPGIDNDLIREPHLGDDGCVITSFQPRREGTSSAG